MDRCSLPDGEGVEEGGGGAGVRVSAADQDENMALVDNVDNATKEFGFVPVTCTMESSTFLGQDRVRTWH